MKTFLVLLITTLGLTAHADNIILSCHDDAKNYDLTVTQENSGSLVLRESGYNGTGVFVVTRDAQGGFSGPGDIGTIEVHHLANKGLRIFFNSGFGGGFDLPLQDCTGQ